MFKSVHIGTRDDFLFWTPLGRGHRVISNLRVVSDGIKQLDSLPDASSSEKAQPMASEIYLDLFSFKGCSNIACRTRDCVNRKKTIGQGKEDTLRTQSILY